MESHNEKPIIFAVVTLFLTFTLVYLAFFREQGQPLFSMDDTVSTTGENSTLSGDSSLTDTGSPSIDTILNNDGRVDLSNPSSSLSGSLKTGSIIKTGTNTLSPSRSGTNISSSSDSGLSLKKKVEGISQLSPWYNSIKIAEILALDVKFAFTDTGAIQYGYLGTGSIDSINPVVKRLGGNIVAIETENDIIKNNLRGDRILFVNIPQVTLIRTSGTEKRLLVTFLVEIDSDKWIIQAPADRYYTAKQHMKFLFEKIYGKIL